MINEQQEQIENGIDVIEGAIAHLACRNSVKSDADIMAIRTLSLIHNQLTTDMYLAGNPQCEYCIRTASGKQCCPLHC